METISNLNNGISLHSGLSAITFATIFLLSISLCSCGKSKQEAVNTSTTSVNNTVPKAVGSSAPFKVQNSNSITTTEEVLPEMPQIGCSVDEEDSPKLPANELKLVSSYQLRQAKIEGAVETTCDAYRHDINGDGTQDLIVYYGLEGFNGGNSWGGNLAVFLATGKTYKLADDISVAAKFFRWVEITSIEGDTIYMKSHDDSRNLDYPNEGWTSYKFTKGKLKEGEFRKRECCWEQ